MTPSLPFSVINAYYHFTMSLFSPFCVLFRTSFLFFFNFFISNFWMPTEKCHLSRPQYFSAIKAITFESISEIFERFFFFHGWAISIYRKDVFKYKKANWVQIVFLHTYTQTWKSNAFSNVNLYGSSHGPITKNTSKVLLFAACYTLFTYFFVKIQRNNIFYYFLENSGKWMINYIFVIPLNSEINNHLYKINSYAVILFLV